MRTWRTGPIGLAEADRLVAGDPPNPEQIGLGVLLDAAKTAAFAEELAGERAAVAGFLAAYRGAEPAGLMRGRRRVRVLLSARVVAVRVAAAVAVLAAGGTAYAAETGHLPAGAQQRAHSMFSSIGVPAPDRAGQPTGRRSGGVAGPTRPSATPATTTTPDPSDPVALGLCHEWDAGQKDPHGKALTAESRRALAAMAGGEAGIAAFCGKLLAEHPGVDAPTAPPSGAGATTTHPGNSGGNGKGHPTSSPHR